MGAPDIFNSLTRKLRGGAAASTAPSEVRLTPYLAIVTAILYMMAADDDISDREISQLQSVTGADLPTLRRAVDYAGTHSVDQFLQQAPALLDAEARLCLLINVCDSLMADGELSGPELLLFDRLLIALGQSKTSFKPYYDAIAVKDRTSVLGDFDAAATAGTLTPPKALVASLLYMMSADGSMEEEEIGRLNAVVGSSQALLKASLHYVSRVRAPQFLEAAALLLDEQQRLCVLLNTCDTMMSDRKVAAGERSLFLRMQSAFGFDGKSFDAYLNILHLKNDVPHDNAHGQRTGVIFERKQTWRETGGEAGAADDAANGGPSTANDRNAPASALEQRLAGTMQQNIDRLSGQFANGFGVDTVQRNARADETQADKLEATGGESDLRSFRDAESGVGRRTGATDDEGAHKKRAMEDAGQHLARHLPEDSDGEFNPGKHWKDADGPAAGRAATDGKAPTAGRHWKDAEGPDDSKAATDDEASVPGRHWRDADGPARGQAMSDAQASAAGPHWRDAGTPGTRRSMEDQQAPLSGTRTADDRKAFDAVAPDDAKGAAKAPRLEERMGSVAERTLAIQAHVDAMQSAKSMRDFRRLPALPLLPVASPAPRALVTVEPRSSEEAARIAPDEPRSGQAMLFASDEGGPLMEQAAPPAGRDVIETNRKLRSRSAIVLPALFLVYGTTMVGETISERAFIENANLATDAHVVHQMATVQQSVYRVAPDAVALKAEGGDATTLTDREKADQFLEQRKQELAGQARRHQGASALAAERQHWFVYAKSIVLMGLGMAFWGVLFRSLRMLHGSTAAGLAGLLVTANGYWLLLRF